jgi:hypothetical protein
MLVAVIFVVVVVEPVFAQQSTTGPIPPPGIDRGIRPVTRDQVVIPGVPAYLWHHGCGPTAVGMVVGYWDGVLFDLVPGDASTQTAAVNAMIADDSGNPDCDAADGDHYQDYSCPIDAPPFLLQDRSQTGGAHASNCVADFFKTSWSSRGNYYGQSWFADADSSWINYVYWYCDIGLTKPAAIHKFFSEFSWDRYKFEIDRGRPMVLLVDTDNNGVSDHFVTAIGYNDATMEYAIYDTWDTNIHWYKWREIGEGISWGVYGITMFYWLRGEIPTLTEWGLITFGVVLLGFITYVFLRRRKAVVSYQ